MKICVDCGLELTLDSFHFNNKERSSRKGYCKDCASLRYKKRREANPEYYKSLWRKASNKYNEGRIKPNRTLKNLGLSPETFDSLSAEQKGKCFICLKETKLVVDHCHEKNVLRKLLCARCNLTLGAVEENISILQSMIDYIKMFE